MHIKSLHCLHHMWQATLQSSLLLLLMMYVILYLGEMLCFCFAIKVRILMHKHNIHFSTFHSYYFRHLY